MFQAGNQVAKDGKRWKAAILRALARCAGDVDKGLDRLASNLINKAMHGDRWAMDHIADRVDGKAMPTIDGDAIPVTVVRVEFVPVGQEKYAGSNRPLEIGYTVPPNTSEPTT